MENYTPNTEHTPKTRSAAQIAASRANGAKSRGPVTDEGKAISAQNARRHGLLSHLTVVDGERTEAFADLCAELVDQFQPANEHERNLVDTMIISIWRRSRALGIETAGLSQIFRKQSAATPTQQPGPQPGSFDIAFRALVSNPDERHALDLLHRYEARHTRAYDRALKSLLAFRKCGQTNPSPYDLPDPEPDTAPEPTPESPGTAPTTQPQIQPNEPEPPAQPDTPVVGQPFLAAAAFPGSRDRTSDSASPSTPAPTQQQIQPNEPEPHPRRTLTRSERRQLKWQKAHPKHIPSNPNPGERRR